MDRAEQIVVSDPIGERLRDVVRMDPAFRAAWRDVCVRHKSAGVPIVVVCDGVVVRIPPEEIVIPPEASGAGGGVQKPLGKSCDGGMSK